MNIRTYSLMGISLTAVMVLRSADVESKAGWQGKESSAWTVQDANQILTDSPWCKKVATTLLRLQSEFERREGGNMGRPHGVGYDDSEAGKKIKADGALVALPPRSKDGMGAIGTVVQLRWETALPVRVAELKMRMQDPPTAEGSGYVLAVYGIPGKFFNGTPDSLGEPLRKMAFLKREGKKDVRPIRAEVFQPGRDIVVAYTFPSSLEITKDDKFIQFEGQIGRFVIVQVFDVATMHYQGKLEM